MRACVRACVRVCVRFRPVFERPALKGDITRFRDVGNLLHGELRVDDETERKLQRLARRCGAVDRSFGPSTFTSTPIAIAHPHSAPLVLSLTIPITVLHPITLTLPLPSP